MIASQSEFCNTIPPKRPFAALPRNDAKGHFRPFCTAEKSAIAINASVVYSITSSAVICSVSGTVMPSVLVVLRLMTSWNFVGCWTGRSAGFSPLQDAVEIGGALSRNCAKRYRGCKTSSRRPCVQAAAAAAPVDGGQAISRRQIGRPMEIGAVGNEGVGVEISRRRPLPSFTRIGSRLRWGRPPD